MDLGEAGAGGRPLRCGSSLRVELEPSGRAARAERRFSTKFSYTATHWARQRSAQRSSESADIAMGA